MPGPHAAAEKPKFQHALQCPPRSSGPRQGPEEMRRSEQKPAKGASSVVGALGEMTVIRKIPRARTRPAEARAAGSQENPGKAASVVSRHGRAACGSGPRRVAGGTFDGDSYRRQDGTLECARWPEHVRGLRSAHSSRLCRAQAAAAPRWKPPGRRPALPKRPGKPRLRLSQSQRAPDKPLTRPAVPSCLT